MKDDKNSGIFLPVIDSKKIQVALTNPIKIHNLKTLMKFSNIILPSSNTFIHGSIFSF